MSDNLISAICYMCNCRRNIRNIVIRHTERTAKYANASANSKYVLDTNS